jgi:hypothetical protein
MHVCHTFVHILYGKAFVLTGMKVMHDTGDGGALWKQLRQRFSE